MKRFLCTVSFVMALFTSALAENAASPIHAGHGMTAPAANDAHYPVDFQQFIHEMDRDMRKMMADMHSPGYTGNADVDFLVMMIPHHQGAVDMARLALIHGKDPLTRKLAEEIIASQTVEIAAMRARLKILRNPRDSDPDRFPALHGTRGDRD